jgi:hypothetical protein
VIRITIDNILITFNQNLYAAMVVTASLLLNGLSHSAVNDKSRINKRNGEPVSSFLPFKSKLLHSVSFVIAPVPGIILRTAFQI